MMRPLLLLLLRVALATASASPQLLFNFTEIRYPWGNTIQVSEIRLYDAANNRIGTINATNPGGVSPYSSQMPFMVSDGRVETKWVDIGFRGNGFSLLYLTPTAGSVVAS